MIPVTQTKMVVKNQKGDMIVRGNCYAACIASILDLPITEVPNIEVLFHIEDNYYYFVLNTWLKSLGCEISTDDRFKVYHDGDWGIIENKRYDWMLECNDKYYICSGISPRGIMHACVYQNGKLIHDPHPSRDGLLTEEYFESIEKITNV